MATRHVWLVELALKLEMLQITLKPSSRKAGFCHCALDLNNTYEQYMDLGVRRSWE